PRVAEDQPRCMQEVPARRKSHQLARPATAVGVVADHRMTDGGEMHADLVRTSRVEMRAQQIRGIEASKPCEISSCRPSATDDCHALSVSRIPGDRPLDG